LAIEQFVRRAFRNWPAKVLSFAAAVLLLVFHDVTRLEERFITVPLSVQVSSELVPASAFPHQARVRLRGESDQVFGILEEDIVASVDLAGHTTEGEFRAPVLLRRIGTAALGNTLELDVEPDSILVSLERKLLKSVERPSQIPCLEMH